MTDIALGSAGGAAIGAGIAYILASERANRFYADMFVFYINHVDYHDDAKKRRQVFNTRYVGYAKIFEYFEMMRNKKRIAAAAIVQPPPAATAIVLPTEQTATQQQQQQQQGSGGLESNKGTGFLDVDDGGEDDSAAASKTNPEAKTAANEADNNTQTPTSKPPEASETKSEAKSESKSDAKSEASNEIKNVTKQHTCPITVRKTIDQEEITKYVQFLSNTYAQQSSDLDHTYWSWNMYDAIRTELFTPQKMDQTKNQEYVNWLFTPSDNRNFTHHKRSKIGYHNHNGIKSAIQKRAQQLYLDNVNNTLFQTCKSFATTKVIASFATIHSVTDLVAARNKTEIVKDFARHLFYKAPSAMSLHINQHQMFDNLSTYDLLTIMSNIVKDVEVIERDATSSSS